MKKIEFVTNSEMNPLRNNDTSRQQTRYEDLVLKPPYRHRLARFSTPSTWIRPVPPVTGTAYAWMMKLRVLEYGGGRFIHPRTFDRQADCPFDRAYQWMASHHPDKLYSRSNPSGIRLLARDMVLGWIIVDEADRPVPKLLIASAWNGGESGEPGLGYTVWTTAQQYDEDKNLTIDAVDPAGGYRLCVERFRAAGTTRPKYAVQVGRTTAPMAPILEAMAEADRDAIIRIEDVVERPSEAIQWQCLEKALGSELYAGFRNYHGSLH